VNQQKKLDELFLKENENHPFFFALGGVNFGCLKYLIDYAKKKL
jgi:hypothetical protein